MAFGSFQDKAGRSKMHNMADINVTPMVDVMLVLLVIFIIAAPMMTPAIRLDLPQAAAKASQQQAESLQIAIDAAGVIYLRGEATDMAVLEYRFRQAASQQPQPDLQLRADKSTRYEMIARLMALAQAQGLNKIAFVMEPLTEPAAAKP